MMVNSSEYLLPIYQMEEWSTIELPSNIAFSKDDHALVRKLRDEDNWKIVIDELKTGIRLRCRSWVGVIRFRDFEVRIVPKLPGSVGNIIRMLAYSLELKNIRILDSQHDAMNENRSLLEIIVLMLVDECEKLVRKGLLKDYVEHEDILPYLRGRLLIDKQVLSRFGRLDSLECRYDERTADIDENRLISIALGFAARHLSATDLLIKTRRLLGMFEELCNISGVDLRTLRNSISYDRRNAHYREAHRLANLLLDSLGISDMYRGTSSCYAFLFDMNRLFEAFVGKWLARVVDGTSYKLEEQRRFRAVIWDADTGGSYSSVIPDFLLTELETGQTYLVADAKYKLYDERRLSTADIYQAFTYAYALNDDNGSMNLPKMLIIFPSSVKNGGLMKKLCIRKNSGTKGAEVRALGLNIQHMLEYLDLDPKVDTSINNDRILMELLKINR